MDREQFGLDEGWDGVAAGQHTLHLLGQHLSNLQQHVLWQDVTVWEEAECAQYVVIVMLLLEIYNLKIALRKSVLSLA